MLLPSGAIFVVLQHSVKADSLLHHNPETLLVRSDFRHFAIKVRLGLICRTQLNHQENQEPCNASAWSKVSDCCHYLISQQD